LRPDAAPPIPMLTFMGSSWTTIHVGFMPYVSFTDRLDNLLPNLVMWQVFSKRL
jgi:hypothetical protein